jgi:microcystin-dependent protein
MANTPNMNLDLPVPTVTTGPEWAEAVNDAFEVVDNHDHSSGNGKKVTSSGLDINLDLEMNANRLVEAKSVKFEDQPSPLSGATHAGSVYEADGNLYYTNSGGVAVQITDGNDIVSSVVIPGSPLMPSGTILDYAGITVPVGFLACDGAAVSRITYADLFTALGTTWGIGDGSTTFNLPNMNGKTGVGLGNYTDSVSGSITRSLAQVGGAERHILTTAELAVHTHIQNAHDHQQVTMTNGAAAQTGPSVTASQFVSTPVPYSPNTGLTTATNQTAGSGNSHNNMQPFAVVWKMIKT